jgi:uncharacterized membrane protein YcaP (DUF421 family)
MDFAAMLFSGWSSLVRVVIVGVPVYVLLLFLLRIAGKHSLAKTNAYGLVVTVSLGSALASAVLTKQVSLADGVLAMALLLGLQYLLSYTISRSESAGRLLTQEPSFLVRDGKILHHALRRERVSESEVLAALRKRGLGCVEEVAAVVLEADGSFSVIPSVGSSASALANVRSPSRE